MVRLFIGIFLLALVCIFGLVLPWFTPVDPLERYASPRNQVPSGAHLLGTTSLGQDIFWLLTFAVRNSLILGLSVAFVSTLIGVFLGSPRATSANYLTGR